MPRSGGCPSPRNQLEPGPRSGSFWTNLSIRHETIQGNPARRRRLSWFLDIWQGAAVVTVLTGRKSHTPEGLFADQAFPREETT